MVFQDDAGLHTVDATTGARRKLAPLPARIAPFPIPPNAVLSPTRRRVIQIDNVVDYHVFDLIGTPAGRFRAEGAFRGWLDDDTLLVEGELGALRRVDVSGTPRGDLPLPAEAAGWFHVRADISPDGSQLTLRRVEDPNLPAPAEDVILVVDVRDGQILDRIVTPSGQEAYPLSWTSDGELVVITRSGITRTSDRGRFHVLPFAPCYARWWTPGRLLARAAEQVDPSGLVGCGTVWEIDVSDGTAVQHWSQKGTALSPDHRTVAFERDGAIWVSALDGTGARRLTAFKGELSALDW